MTSTAHTGPTSPIAGNGPSSATAEAVRVEQVSFRYGAADVLRDVSLTVAAGEFLSILGPSGCGKTTLLKLIGGDLDPDRGRVVLQGRDIAVTPVRERRIGMVFQNYALFPHLTVRKNVAFGLEVRGGAPKEIARKVDEVLDQVRLEQAERNRYPAELSGGQQQRVAIARALAFEPQLLLLDEPFASLDRHLRDRLRDELRRIHLESRVTTVLVTHDQDEALGISDRVAVMSAGRVLQAGTPQELYARPQSSFVAGFLGEANLVSGALLGRSAEAEFLIRPEQITLQGDCPGRIRSVRYQGAFALLDVEHEGIIWKVRTPAGSDLRPGQEASFQLPDDPWELPNSTGERGP